MKDGEPRERTDARLMVDSERDPRAFGELYRRHVRRVYAWHARRLEWAAADLTAETFARAWIARGGFRDEHDGWALPFLGRRRRGVPAHAAALAPTSITTTRSGAASAERAASRASRSRP